MDAIKKSPLTFITLFGALLRLSTLTVESLWYDETFTAWLAGLPLANLVAATLGDVHPPTWYLIEWAMVQSLGNNALALRLVSALAGIALIPMVYHLARAFDFDNRRSLAAAALASVAPFLVYYSQEARAYSLIFLLTTIATWAIVTRRWWVFVVSAIAAMYLHNLTVLYIAALGWLALYRLGGHGPDHPRRPDWRILQNLSISFFVVGIIWAPWLVWGLLPQVSDVTNGFWVRPPSYGTPIYIITAWLWSGKAVLLALVTVPLLTLAIIKGVRMTPRPVVWQLAGLLLIPLGLCVIASLVVAPVLVERVIGSSAIALYLLIAPALIPPAWPRPGLNWPTLARYALPTLFILTLAIHYTAFYGTDRIGRYPWDYGLDPFLSEARPDDAIFHANLATYIVYSHYLPQKQYVWQQANDLSQSLTDSTKWAMDMNQAQFNDVVCTAPRFWLAFYENPTTGPAERAEVARIVNQYKGELKTTILKNSLVNARIYKLEAPCNLETVTTQ